MIFSVGLSESISCLHCIKQLFVSACLSYLWLMCKIGLFLLPYIPEAGDVSGFRFSLPPEAHKVFHVLVGWSQTEYYTWWHTLQVALDWSAPFCLFCVLSVFFFCVCVLWWVRGLLPVMNCHSGGDKFGHWGALVLLRNLYCLPALRNDEELGTYQLEEEFSCYEWAQQQSTNKCAHR